MRVIAFWYGAQDSLYARMARVLEHSASRYHETSVVHVPDPCADRSEAFVLKARDWTHAIRMAEDGETLALLDVDMIVTAPLDGALRDGHDLAVTSRRAFQRDRRLRAVNSGAIFVRVSDRVREWFAPWERRTRGWCAKNTPDRIRFGDQDALIQMLRSEETRQSDIEKSRREVEAEISIRYLPCSTWNATQTEWEPRAPRSARILHVKSDARKRIIDPERPVKPGARALAERWLEHEAMALIAESRP